MIKDWIERHWQMSPDILQKLLFSVLVILLLLVIRYFLLKFALNNNPILHQGDAVMHIGGVK